MFKKNKTNIRILPIFIFIAVLTLSIKVNNVFDIYSQVSKTTFSISQSQASAQEKVVKETVELSEVLKKGDDGINGQAAGNPNAFTQSEILILQELAERRETLDARSKEIDKRAIQLKVAEDEIEKKLAQLKIYEQKLEKLIGNYNKQEQEKVDALVKLYSTMKPKDAARIFNTLDMDITVAILKGMKPAVSSAILAQMQSERAKAVTSELIGNNIK